MRIGTLSLLKYCIESFIFALIKLCEKASVFGRCFFCAICPLGCCVPVARGLWKHLGNILDTFGKPQPYKLKDKEMQPVCCERCSES